MITIILDKGEYSSEETIKGNIELVPDTEIYISDIELCLYFIEEWNYSKSEEKIDKNNHKQCVLLVNLGVNKFLPEGDNNLIHLDPILHLFPFKLKLPDSLLPSFEFPKHDFRAYLRYSLYAKLKAPQTNLSTSKLVFILASSKANASFSVDNTFTLKKWGMFGKGLTKMSALFPTKYFKFSDNIPLHINIDNTLGKMKATLIKINLIRTMILKDNNNNNKEKYTCKDKIYKKIFKIDVKSGEKKIYMFMFPLSEIPFDDFSFFDNVNLYNWTKKTCEFMPSIESTILSCQYKIIITLYFDSFITKSDRPRLEVPIYIIHVINDNFILPSQTNLPSDVEESNEEEIRKQKKEDFVIIGKNKLNGEAYEIKKQEILNRNRTGKIFDNSVLDKLANNNKDKSNNKIENKKPLFKNNTIINNIVDNGNNIIIEEKNNDIDNMAENNAIFMKPGKLQTPLGQKSNNQDKNSLMKGGIKKPLNAIEDNKDNKVKNDDNNVIVEKENEKDEFKMKIKTPFGKKSKDNNGDLFEIKDEGEAPTYILSNQNNIINDKNEENKEGKNKK